MNWAPPGQFLMPVNVCDFHLFSGAMEGGGLGKLSPLVKIKREIFGGGGLAN